MKPIGTPILQDWITFLPLRHQGVLLTGIRACDGRPKNTPEKYLLREARGLILVAFDDRELTGHDGFMCKFPYQKAIEAFPQFLTDMEALPLHFVLHYMHMAEVIGYNHPHKEVTACYLNIYAAMAKKMHLKCETASELRNRLCEDRIANCNVE